MRAKSLTYCRLLGALFCATLVLLNGPSLAKDVNAYHGRKGSDFSAAFAYVKAELSLPSQDNGVIKKISVKKGDTVEEGTLLVELRDDDVRAQLAVTKAAVESAEKEAASDIEVKYSISAAGVAEKFYEVGVNANRLSSRSVTLTELDRRRLDWERAEFQVLRERMNKELAALDHVARLAEYNAATVAVGRRVFKAPFPGLVVEVHHREGEWVQQGEPLLRLMDFSVMRVKSQIISKEYDPEELIGKRVEFKATRAKDREVVLRGTITYVSPVVLSSGEYEVEAEVDNVQENGTWLVPHGASGRLTFASGE